MDRAGTGGEERRGEERRGANVLCIPSSLVGNEQKKHLNIEKHDN